MGGPAALRTRRGAALVASVAIPAGLVFGLGHRGVHMARNELVPGAGLIDEHLAVGVVFLVLGIAATVAWLRWGADWTVLAVVAGAMAASAVLTGSPHVAALRSVTGLRPVAMAHEFPLVVLVVAALSWLRSLAGRLPLVGRLLARRHRHRQGLTDLDSLPAVDRCRAVAVLALGGPVEPAVRDAALAGDVERRARRIGMVARGRRGGDPFRRDHASARTARSLVGALDAAATERWAADARRNLLGVPCSEPGWVRPLDGTLAAIALARSGYGDAADRWAAAMRSELGLRRGHRPAWWWTPLGVAAGSAPAWEHATATGLARRRPAGRRPGLGRAAGPCPRRRGAWWRAARRRAPDRRGAVWLALVDDPEAARIVGRPGVRRDPLACALDQLATALRDERSMLLPPSVPCAVGAVEGSLPT